MMDSRHSVGSHGMVVSNHPLASTAGMLMFARGGNAFDAAIATAFALTVVEPMMVGLFGSGTLLLRHGATGRILTADAHAIAPSLVAHGCLPYEDFEKDQERFEVGHAAVGVSPALKVWLQLHAEFGALPLPAVVEPAALYAKNGFAVSPFLSRCIGYAARELGRFAASASVFLPGGAEPAAESTLHMPDYGQTLDAIARDGSAVLYGGAIGRLLIDDMQRCQGLVVDRDLLSLNDVRPEKALSSTYRDHEVWTVLPPAGGIELVEALNILEGFDLASRGPTQSLHLIAETLKLVFEDSRNLIGDPQFVPTPVDRLTAKEFAAERRRAIRLDMTMESPTRAPGTRAMESADTTHLTVADRDGNLVAITHTLHGLFGSKVTTPRTGMLLNNAMCRFDRQPGGPNVIGPGKRVRSSMAPVLVCKGGDPIFALGALGGSRIFGTIVQAVVNIVDHRMSLQAAVEAPRIWTDGGVVEVEDSAPESFCAELELKGHLVQRIRRVGGGMNGVLFEPSSGVLHGAACWRSYGTPMGISKAFDD